MGRAFQEAAAVAGSREGLALLSAAVLPVLWVRFGLAGFYDRVFGTAHAGWTWGRAVYQQVSHFLLFFVVPWLLLRRVLKENPTEWGWGWGDGSKGWPWVWGALPLVAVGMVLTVRMPEFQPPYFREVYPVVRDVASAGPFGFLLYLPLLAMYYVSFEWFYRGWMLFGLRRRLGDVLAVLVQTVPSVLVHVDRPDAEILAAVPAEIFFGWLALRTGSIVYPALIHGFVGVCIELACALL